MHYIPCFTHSPHGCSSPCTPLPSPVDRLDEFDEAFKAASARLDKEEQLEDKLVGTQSVPVRAWFCLTCKVYTFGKGKVGAAMGRLARHLIVLARPRALLLSILSTCMLHVVSLCILQFALPPS